MGGGASMETISLSNRNSRCYYFLFKDNAGDFGDSPGPFIICAVVGVVSKKIINV